MKARPRHVAEYAALRLIAGLVCLLPYRAALALGWLVAKIGFLASPAKIRRARARMRSVLGEDASEREIHRITWLAWRNLCFNGVDMLRAPRCNLNWIKKVTDHQEIEKLTAAREGGKNVILAVPHMGNWELAGIAMGLMGIPIVTIVREQKNRLVNAYLNRLRTRTGALGLDRDDPKLVRLVLRAIKNGHVLCILPDIRARTDALHVPFLGGEVTVAAGMALFARQSNVPILPAVVTRQGWARHKWEGFDLVRPDPSVAKAEDWQRMTEEVLAVFDREIRKHPEQYFWFNKKWILDPVAVGDGERPTNNNQHSAPNS
jgi:KDO2-lipid IV(A) lauroyltransferase